MLETYFKHRLEQAGYADCEPQWRFAYSQGDGMAFYGGLSEQSLMLLARRLLKAEDQQVFFDIDGEGHSSLAECIDVEISRSSLSNHYAHENTMCLVFHDNSETDLNSSAEQVLELFESALRTDIHDLSVALASEGYALIEAGQKDAEGNWGMFKPTVVKAWQTDRFTVVLKEHPEPEYDPFFLWEDENQVMEEVRSFIEGHARYLRLSVEIEAQGLILGQDGIGGLVQRIDGSDRSEYRRIIRELMREAAVEARERIKGICLAA